MLLVSNRSLLALVVAAVIGLAVALPALPARAQHSPRPPFEIVFPQEIDKTTFHNDFGDRRSGGRRHQGTDLMTEEKMVEVYAIADGVVTKIDESRRPGRYLYISHEGGWESLYVHLNDDNPGTDDGQAPWHYTLAPGLEVGSVVQAGELIGWAGDSGNAEGTMPHTHFELHLNGRTLNPYHYLAEAYERDLEDEVRRELVMEHQTAGELIIV